MVTKTASFKGTQPNHFEVTRVSNTFCRGFLFNGYRHGHRLVYQVLNICTLLVVKPTKIFQRHVVRGNLGIEPENVQNGFSIMANE